MEKYSFHRVNLGQNKEEHYEEERKKRSRSGYDAGSHHDFRANSFRNMLFTGRHSMQTGKIKTLP